MLEVHQAGSEFHVSGFAFNQTHRLSTLRDHKIDFAFLFVTKKVQTEVFRACGLP